MARRLRLGARSSRLAIAQAEWVAARITEATGIAVELVPMHSDGDLLAPPMQPLGEPNLFVDRLRSALVGSVCELLVHNLKDVPLEPYPGIALAAVTERFDTRDALVSRDGPTLRQLPKGARVGTASPRRAAALNALRKDLEVVQLRGNLDERLARVNQDDLDAVVVSAAGLELLGLREQAAERFALTRVLPAAGQGALAVEALAVAEGEQRDEELQAALDALEHEPSRLTVTAERAVLMRLKAGWEASVGASASIVDEGVKVTAAAYSDDGAERLLVEHHEAFAQRQTPESRLHAAERAGTAAARLLLAGGAAQLTELAARR